MEGWVQGGQFGKHGWSLHEHERADSPPLALDTQNSSAPLVPETLLKVSALARASLASSGTGIRGNAPRLETDGVADFFRVSRRVQKRKSTEKSREEKRAAALEARKVCLQSIFEAFTLGGAAGREVAVVDRLRPRPRPRLRLARAPTTCDQQDECAPRDGIHED